jgi:hypothetical protein
MLFTSVHAKRVPIEPGGKGQSKQGWKVRARAAPGADGRNCPALTIPQGEASNLPLSRSESPP